MYANASRLDWSEVIHLRKAEGIAEFMYNRRIWGGKIGLSKYPFVNFLKLFASSIWPLITFLFDIPKNSMLLDFGSGVGNYSLWLTTSLRCNVVGIDLSRHATRIAKRTMSDTSYSENSHVIIDFIVAEGTYLPFKSECFDGVFAMDIFGHIPNLDRAFSEISRVLKLHGIGSFCTESSGLTKFQRRVTKLLGYNPWDILNGHISLFTFEQLKEMLENQGLLVRQRKFEPRFLDLLISTTWSGGGGLGWLQDLIPKLRSSFKLRRVLGKALEIVYSMRFFSLLAYSLRTALYRLFLDISSLDTGEIYIKVQKANKDYDMVKEA